ncbi:hypothetical protein L1987_71777 [Smallanthus sonchifolius]|uniref:Uncharacterized protein n=1 Tax=Smallanthus sonchifolius TaxID=185202 RepID=A0ACB9ASH1_9ASTR|nr:hypothetical protein L1987_71777 [Smallanthus sonchifolius]
MLLLVRLVLVGSDSLFCFGFRYSVFPPLVASLSLSRFSSFPFSLALQFFSPVKSPAARNPATNLTVPNSLLPHTEIHTIIRIPRLRNHFAASPHIKP